jgi:hypothetical protein
LSILGVVACGGGSRRASEAAAAEAKAEAGRTAARAEAAARVEAGRLAALWTYFDLPVGKGRQVSASIRSSENVATGGAEPKAVMLVFRDHPSWGRSSYLVLENGDFNCTRCTVGVSVDGAEAIRVPAHEPRTNEAIALFIDDHKKLWALTNDAKQVRIEFPVKAGGTRTAAFDVGGLDSTKMPGWGARPAQRGR